MPEERIQILVKADGSLESDSHGIKGEACLEELEALLGGLADVSDVQMTREYHEPPRRQTHKQTGKSNQKLGGGRS